MKNKKEVESNTLPPYIKIFEGSINKTTIQELIDELHLHEGKIRLHFSTNGGYLIDTFALVEYLNIRKDDITLILSGYIESAGGVLMQRFKGKMELGEAFDYVSLHLTDRETYNFREVKFNSYLVEATRISNLKYVQEWKKYFKLTAKEVRLLEGGEDILIPRNRIEKIIK